MLEGIIKKGQGETVKKNNSVILILYLPKQVFCFRIKWGQNYPHVTQNYINHKEVK